jgi:alkanesulfonate monooxygenase SsuD/methylene tetrahydromethanopterin reductase-like flavin-dependent oxidoreductase (luciferase family)
VHPFTRAKDVLTYYSAFSRGVLDERVTACGLCSPHLKGTPRLPWPCVTPPGGERRGAQASSGTDAIVTARGWARGFDPSKKGGTPMQFGLITLFDFFSERQNELTYYQDTLDLMIYAEKLGFDSGWVGEEHFYSLGICPSPPLFLAALARATTRLRLGTAVSVLTLEHPLRKAEDFAMLDILSGGRLNVGIGKGVYPKHFEGLRVSMQDMRARYEEALEILERAWTQESFSYEGQFWQIPEISLSPKPLQKPHPPLYRSIASPEAFEPAGAKGHGALFVPWLTPETRLKEGMTCYRAALRAHGHQAVPPSVFVFFLFVDPDYRQALAEARDTTARYVELILDSVFPAGLPANLPPDDLLRGAWDMLTSMVDHLEERAIIGTPRDCRQRLAEVREEWGIEHIAFYLHAGARDITRARRGLELFAREVMPAFR